MNLHFGYTCIMKLSLVQEQLHDTCIPVAEMQVHRPAIPSAELMVLSINQSINQTSIVPVSPEDQAGDLWQCQVLWQEYGDDVEVDRRDLHTTGMEAEGP